MSGKFIQVDADLNLHYEQAGQGDRTLLLVPNLRIAAVHESGDGGREIDTELALSPGPVLTIETDDPDRDYGLVGLGLVGALNNGQQWFVDYETRVSHDFIDDWSLSVGYLLEL